MTKKDLAQELAIKLKGDIKTAEKFLDALLETVQEMVLKGESIYIPGLGTFDPTKK